MSPALRVRLAKAQTVIDAYCQTTKHRSPEEALIVLLADLMHWTDGNGLDFQKALDHAQFHHHAEVQP